MEQSQRVDLGRFRALGRLGKVNSSFDGVVFNLQHQAIFLHDYYAQGSN